MQVSGIGYPAIIVGNLQESIEFYERLGLRVLYSEPNRDDPESATVMLGAADDTTLLLVGPLQPGTVNIAEAQPGIGSMQYLSFHVTNEQMDEMFHVMSEAGVQGSEVIERGYERLVFMQDPNGVLVLLITWSVDPPEGVNRTTLLEAANRHREASGAPYLEAVHLQQAAAELA
jgi:catechol 2,3-dioxygenase-like lactoylglutathione lyase family enzyme